MSLNSKGPSNKWQVSLCQTACTPWIITTPTAFKRNTVPRRCRKTFQFKMTHSLWLSTSSGMSVTSICRRRSDVAMEYQLSLQTLKSHPQSLFLSSRWWPVGFYLTCQRAMNKTVQEPWQLLMTGRRPTHPTGSYIFLTEWARCRLHEAAKMCFVHWLSLLCGSLVEDDRAADMSGITLWGEFWC